LERAAPAIALFHLFSISRIARKYGRAKLDLRLEYA